MMICSECDSEVAHKPGCSMWEDDESVMTPKREAEQAHRLTVERAARLHPDWSTRDWAKHWGDVNHATVSRWFRRYGIKTNPRYGRPITDPPAEEEA